MTFRGLRGGTFLAVFAVAAVALVVATAIILSEVGAQLLQAIERNLVAQARMAAALVSEHPTDGSPAALDAEAQALAASTVPADIARRAALLLRLDRIDQRRDQLAVIDRF